MATQGLPTKSRDKYKQLAHIGRGTYGDVFLCEHVETGEHVCMKEIDLTFHSPDDRMRCLAEVALLKHLPADSSIVGFREAFWAQSSEASAQVLVLILEHADGGDLEQHLRFLEGSPIQEDAMRRIFMQLAQGVNYLHSHRVVHRDLKCGNVFLFRSGRAVLGDFGTSKMLPPITGSDQVLEPQGLTSTVVGSPLYMSPELLEGEPHGFATDIWSLGCVLYDMLSGGKHAFGAPSYPAVVFRITQGDYDPLDTASVSMEAHNLIASMLQKEPQTRPSIVEVLRSPWLQTHDVMEVKNEEGELVPKSAVAMNCQAATADQQESVSNARVQEPTTSLIHLTEALPLPVTVDNARTCKLGEVSASEQIFPPPPPPPVHRTSKSPIRQVDRPQRNHKETNCLRSRAASPLIQLDLQLPPAPVLPSRKHFSTAASIPFKHYHQQRRHSIPVQPTTLEVRGVHITGTARHQIPAPNSIPKT